MKGKFFRLLTVALLLVVLLCSCDLNGSKTEEKVKPQQQPTTPETPVTPVTPQDPLKGYIWAVGNVGFSTLQEAVDYVEQQQQVKAVDLKTGEIKLLVDNTVGEGVLISFPANIVINLNGNSYGLRGTRGFESLNSSSNVTLLNGSLIHDSRATFDHFISNSGAMTLNGIEIIAENKDINLNDGSFSVQSNSNIKSSFVVKNGNVSFANSRVTGAINLQNGVVTLKNGATIELEGITIPETLTDALVIEDGAQINLNQNDKPTLETLYKVIKGDAETILKTVLHEHIWQENNEKTIQPKLFIPGYKCYECATCGEELFGELATNDEGVVFVDESIRIPSTANTIQDPNSEFRDIESDDLGTLLNLITDFVEAVQEVSDVPSADIGFNFGTLSPLSVGGNFTVAPVSGDYYEYVYQDTENLYRDVKCQIKNVNFNKLEIENDKLLFSGNYDFAFLDTADTVTYNVKFSKDLLVSGSAYYRDISKWNYDSSTPAWIPVSEWTPTGSELKVNDVATIVEFILTNSKLTTTDLTATIKDSDGTIYVLYANGSIEIKAIETEIDSASTSQYYTELEFTIPNTGFEFKINSPDKSLTAKANDIEFKLKCDEFNGISSSELSYDVLLGVNNALKVSYNDNLLSADLVAKDWDFDGELVLANKEVVCNFDSSANLFDFKLGFNGAEASAHLEDFTANDKITIDMLNTGLNIDLKLKNQGNAVFDINNDNKVGIKLETSFGENTDYANFDVNVGVNITDAISLNTIDLYTDGPFATDLAINGKENSVHAAIKIAPENFKFNYNAKTKVMDGLVEDDLNLKDLVVQINEEDINWDSIVLFVQDTIVPLVKPLFDDFIDGIVTNL